MIKYWKNLTTTKRIILFLFLNCIIIELFTMWAIYQNLFLVQTVGASLDFSPLVTLGTTIIGEVMAYACYIAKSTKENTVNGITYLKVKNQLEGEGVVNDGSEEAAG